MTALDVELCGDCVMAAAGYDEHELGHPFSAEYPPLGLLAGMDVSALADGDRPREGHFSPRPCEGCGEPLAGTRFCYSAQAPVVHVDYPHEPGFLYDCPACEAMPGKHLDDD
jgi:hypothetical protein